MEVGLKKKRLKKTVVVEESFDEVDLDDEIVDEEERCRNKWCGYGFILCYWFVISLPYRLK